MITKSSFYSTPVSRYAMLICSWLLFAIIGALLMSIIAGDGSVAARMRIAIVIQDLFLFIIPAIVTAVFITRKPAELLCITKGFPIYSIVLVLMIMVVTAPAMQMLINFNQSLSFPDWLEPVERWMRASEEAAAKSLEGVTGGTSWGSLILSVLLVGVMAGFSEEIFFRGALQRIMSTSGLAPHIAIWVTAFIFSAMHLQFFGFLPRLILGAFFGYLLWWSGSLWLPVCAHALNNTLAILSEWERQRMGDSLTIDASLVENPGAHTWIIILAGVALGAAMLVYLRKMLLKGSVDAKRAASEVESGS